MNIERRRDPHGHLRVSQTSLRIIGLADLEKRAIIVVVVLHEVILPVLLLLFASTTRHTTVS